ncbi:MAG: endonuclease III [Eubacteriales bacterium]
MAESQKAKKARAEQIVFALKDLYPTSICSLNYEKEHELLFAVRMSAQCTDARVNMVTPELFGTYPTLEALASADIADIERIIHSTGFYRAKAKDIVLGAGMILSDFQGKVPDNMEDLLKLPGIGRKTANLMLGDVHNVPGVVIADTHCIRITGLMGLTDGSKDPLKVENQLRKILPPEESNDFCHRMVLHGRAVCVARRPQCDNCIVAPFCQHFKGNI